MAAQEEDQLNQTLQRNFGYKRQTSFNHRRVCSCCSQPWHIMRKQQNQKKNRTSTWVDSIHLMNQTNDEKNGGTMHSSPHHQTLIPWSCQPTIRDGLIIMGKQIWARRMEKEPRRCLNCQSLGSPHLAAVCGKPTVCGTCGKGHQTAKCTEDDQVSVLTAKCLAMRHGTVCAPDSQKKAKDSST